MSWIREQLQDAKEFNEALLGDIRDNFIKRPIVTIYMILLFLVVVASFIYFGGMIIVAFGRYFLFGLGG